MHSFDASAHQYLPCSDQEVGRWQVDQSEAESPDFEIGWCGRASRDGVCPLDLDWHGNFLWPIEHRGRDIQGRSCPRLGRWAATTSSLLEASHHHGWSTASLRAPCCEGAQLAHGGVMGDQMEVGPHGHLPEPSSSAKLPAGCSWGSDPIQVHVGQKNQQPGPAQNPTTELWEIMNQ